MGGALADNRIVILGGLSGVGKSTLLKSVDTSKYMIKNLGDMIEQIVEEVGHNEDRDDFKKQKSGTVMGRAAEAFRRVSAMNGDIIVDTHVSLKNGPRYTPGLPLNTLRLIPGLKGLIYIVASPQEISGRRAKDTARHRDTEEDTIQKQMDMDMATLSFYSSYLNISLYIINNREGRKEQATAELASALSDVFSD
ncbi:adenylate kinase [mine drainage metagenome]|uniref:Adenylate kinase n=1 Tax=mine drainage metagenome TaxID=410659 RepID=T0YEQ1_9ZZZZ